VLQADGGTRTASITGAYMALARACRKLLDRRMVARDPLRDSVSAISVGIVDGCPLLDLSYPEDARAGVDMNVVRTGSGRLVEVQGTAEGSTFDRAELLAMLDLADKGTDELARIQREVLAR
jgi:ribonuclease PH